jgi:hypothetical protein
VVVVPAMPEATLVVQEVMQPIVMQQHLEILVAQQVVHMKVDQAVVVLMQLAQTLLPQLAAPAVPVTHLLFPAAQ